METVCESKIDAILEPQPKHPPKADNKVIKESKQRKTVSTGTRPKRIRSRPMAPKVYQMSTTKQEKQKKVHRVDIHFGNDINTGKENNDPLKRRKTKKSISSSTKTKSNPRRKTGVKTKKKCKTNELDTTVKRREWNARSSGTPKIAKDYPPPSLSFLGDEIDTVPEWDQKSVGNRCSYQDEMKGSLNDTALPSMFDEMKDDEELDDGTATSHERNEAMSASLRATTRLSELLERFRVSAMPP